MFRNELLIGADHNIRFFGWGKKSNFSDLFLLHQQVNVLNFSRETNGFIKVANYHRGRVVIEPLSKSAYSETFITEL